MKILAKVSKERESEYGNFRDNAYVAQEMKTLTVNPTFSKVQREALDQILSKISRLACGNPDHLDGWLDISNFARLAYVHTKNNPRPRNVLTKPKDLYKEPKK